MSVQVRRRREAASFLSTYVGAQGELLVDTTNDRVQIHDGATAGGWPAAGIGDLPGRNALINGNFAINQRGYSSSASIATGAYAHDRWKAIGGGTSSAYTFTQGVPDTTISITNGAIAQIVDAPNVYASSMWLSWVGTAPAYVLQGSTVFANFVSGLPTKVGGVTVNAILLTGLSAGSALTVGFGAGTLALVQLEAALPNAGPTRFERRHGEITLCQRYYYVFPLSGQDLFYSIGSGSTLRYCVKFPVTMRATPSCTVTAGTSGTFSAGMPTAAGLSPDHASLAGDTTQANQYAYLTSFTASAEL